MQFPRRKFLHVAVGAVGICILSIGISNHRAWSQTARTIKFVIPVPPGGALDFLGRLMAEQIGRAEGAKIIVENRAGAANVIAMEAVARAAPDGNTVLINGPALAISPHLRKVDFDPFASFEAICHLVNSPTVLVVNSASPYRTLADLLSAARAKPGTLTLASVGPGTPFHIGFELLRRGAGIDMNYVTYPGSAPAVTALLGEHVTTVLGNYVDVVSQVNAGKLRVLASATPSRIDPLPDVPTFAESGYEGVEADVWFGTVVPAHTPKETVAQLAGWFTQALQGSDVRSKLAVQQLYPVGQCGVDYSSFVRKRYTEYGRVIREANIKGE
jgi:tripartite-type tricarboxylate transporter receptor subunit TctC